ncbi:hypothetical protein ANO11243_034640 [Dothideomycetidae sp. 11243]|nr:hypothetical protein ANO11243_034640 [fungal sp. No.11243]
MKVFALAIALSTASAGARRTLEHDAGGCSSYQAQLVQLQKHVTSPTYFCQVYLSAKRGYSPISGLTATEVLEGCLCILPASTSAAAATTNPTATRHTTIGSSAKPSSKSTTTSRSTTRSSLKSSTTSSLHTTTSMTASSTTSSKTTQSVTLYAVNSALAQVRWKLNLDLSLNKTETLNTSYGWLQTATLALGPEGEIYTSDSAHALTVTWPPATGQNSWTASEITQHEGNGLGFVQEGGIAAVQMAVYGGMLGTVVFGVANTNDKTGNLVAYSHDSSSGPSGSWSGPETLLSGNVLVSGTTTLATSQRGNATDVFVFTTNNTMMVVSSDATGHWTSPKTLSSGWSPYPYMSTLQAAGATQVFWTDDNGNWHQQTWYGPDIEPPSPVQLTNTTAIGGDDYVYATVGKGGAYYLFTYDNNNYMSVVCVGASCDKSISYPYSFPTVAFLYTYPFPVFARNDPDDFPYTFFQSQSGHLYTAYLNASGWQMHEIV